MIGERRKLWYEVGIYYCYGYSENVLTSLSWLGCSPRKPHFFSFISSLRNDWYIFVSVSLRFHNTLAHICLFHTSRFRWVCLHQRSHIALFQLLMLPLDAVAVVVFVAMFLATTCGNKISFQAITSFSMASVASQQNAQLRSSVFCLDFYWSWKDCILDGFSCSYTNKRFHKTLFRLWLWLCLWMMMTMMTAWREYVVHNLHMEPPQCDRW